MRTKIFTLLLFISSLGLYAQQDLTIHNLDEIPQSTYSNPSNRFNGNWYLGLPGISSNYLSFSNSGFAYSDAIRKRGDSLLLDFNALIDELEDDNYLSFNTKIDLLSFGFSIGDKTQITVNVSEVASFKLSYPKDFVSFIYRGNASFNDNTADLDGIGINMIHYREYAVGLSQQLTQRLRIGARAKYLYGMENIYSRKTDISLHTDPETFAITTQADIEINTAGLDDVDFDEEGTSNYLTGRANTGYGLDLGANYDLSEKLSFNASILDLGFINWNDYTSSYKSSGEFSYSGIEINAFGEEDTTSDETSFDRVADSLEEAFQIDTSKGGYTAPLTARFLIGANYRFNERSFGGAIFQSEVFQSKLRPSFTLHFNRKMTKWITLAASCSYINRSINNVGFGLNINPGPVQLYIVSDNVLGAFRPQHTRHLQLRFGINFIFGSQKSKELRTTYKGAIGDPDKKKGADSDNKSEENEETD